MYNILITGLGAGITYNDAQLAELKKLGSINYQQDMTREELLEAIKDADVLLTDCPPIDEEVISNGKHLKLIVELGVGYDNIDVASATRHNVLVCNTPTVYTEQVSELTVALVFALSKHLYEASTLVQKEGVWDAALLDPRQVSRKTLGVVGCGRIGSAFIRKMSGLEMNVLVYDPYIPQENITALGAVPTDFDDLLAKSDIISIHTPKTEETTNMFSVSEFGKMKDGVIIVNTARGGIIDESALLDALKSGKVLAAGLDLINNEAAALENCPLRNQPRVILTPHMAWKTEYSIGAVTEQSIKDVFAYAEGKPVYMCNPEIWEK